VVSRTQKLLDEDLTFVIRRLTIYEGIRAEHAERVRNEFLRFVALRQQYSGTLTPSQDVDKFWHAFILYTEEYTAFCLKHLGEYMHHRPQEHFAHPSATSVAIKRTMEHLDEMFQHYDADIWGQPAICSDPGDCGCP